VRNECPTPASVVCVPGFGDTCDYWVGSLDLDPATTLKISWPGIWGEPDVPEPYSQTVATLATKAERRVVIGHSLGARAALEATALATGSHDSPRGLILIGPGIGPLSILADGHLEEWAQAGSRRTVRTNPYGPGSIEFSIPYTFATDLSAHDLTPAIELPVRVVLLGEDPYVRNEAIRTYLSLLDPANVEIVEIEGPHRFWESDASTLAVLSTRVAEWIAELSN
jgi:pimeloyl-ACP methyl ester carboxylesterase